MLERSSALPEGAVEIRAEEAYREMPRSPFVGGVGGSCVYLYRTQTRRCYAVPLAELVSAAAEASGCTPEELLDRLRWEVTLVRPEPGGPLRARAVRKS